MANPLLNGLTKKTQPMYEQNQPNLKGILQQLKQDKKIRKALREVSKQEYISPAYRDVGVLALVILLYPHVLEQEPFAELMSHRDLGPKPRGDDTLNPPVGLMQELVKRDPNARNLPREEKWARVLLIARENEEYGSVETVEALKDKCYPKVASDWLLDVYRRMDQRELIALYFQLMAVQTDKIKNDADKQSVVKFINFAITKVIYPRTDLLFKLLIVHSYVSPFGHWFSSRWGFHTKRAPGVLSDLLQTWAVLPDGIPADQRQNEIKKNIDPFLDLVFKRRFFSIFPSYARKNFEAKHLLDLLLKIPSPKLEEYILNDSHLLRKIYMALNNPQDPNDPTSVAEWEEHKQRWEKIKKLESRRGFVMKFYAAMYRLEPDLVSANQTLMLQNIRDEQTTLKQEIEVIKEQMASRVHETPVVDEEKHEEKSDNIVQTIEQHTQRISATMAFQYEETRSRISNIGASHADYLASDENIKSMLKDESMKRQHMEGQLQAIQSTLLKHETLLSEIGERVKEVPGACNVINKLEQLSFSPSHDLFRTPSASPKKGAVSRSLSESFNQVGTADSENNDILLTPPGFPTPNPSARKNNQNVTSAESASPEALPLLRTPMGFPTPNPSARKNNQNVTSAVSASPEAPAFLHTPLGLPTSNLSASKNNQNVTSAESASPEALPLLHTPIGFASPTGYPTSGPSDEASSPLFQTPDPTRATTLLQQDRNNHHASDNTSFSHDISKLTHSDEPSSPAYITKALAIAGSENGLQAAPQTKGVEKPRQPVSVLPPSQPNTHFHVPVLRTPILPRSNGLPQPLPVVSVGGNDKAFKL